MSAVVAQCPDQVITGARLLYQVPDQVVSGAPLFAFCPDKLAVGAQLTAQCPDAVSTNGNLIVLCPDKVVIVAPLTAMCPDSTVTGAIPVSLAQSLAAEQPFAHPAAYGILMQGSTVIDFDELSLGWRIGAGWDWSATLPATQDIDLYSSLLWRIILVDGLGYTLTSPPLFCKVRTASDPDSETGPSINVSGIDQATYLMGTPNVSFPTFVNTTSITFLNTLGNLVQLKIQGADNFPLPNEEVKRQLLADAVNRMRAVGAQESLVDESGVVQLYNWDNVGGPLNFDWSDLKKTIDITKFKTSIKIGKHSPIQGNNLQGAFDFQFTSVGPKSVPLPNPLIRPVAFDRSTLGFCDVVCFWDDDPTKRTAGLVSVSQQHQGLGLNLPTPNSNNPAKYMTLYCFNPGGTIQVILPGLNPQAVVCHLHVQGTPLGSTTIVHGVDQEFMYPYAPAGRTPYTSGTAPVWAAPDWVDSMFPSKVWVQGIAPNALELASKGWDRLEMDGVMQVNVKLRQRYIYADVEYKVDSIHWKIGSNSLPNTAIELLRIQAPEAA